jgi:predicted ABC-type transport system involved in lysophospholipase L1 biosynthesis ATPase subunit
MSDERGLPLLAARGVRKSFAIGERQLEILHGVHLELYAGEVLALMGPSGAGKSTLLHVLGLLDEPSEGEVLLDGRSAWKLPGEERARLRNQRLGFVFQFYHLLSELTALENVLLQPMIAQGRGQFLRSRSAHVAKARELLAGFGMAPRSEHRPSQLSGGERQRVALARALFGDPAIVIADEPTGNLDSATGEKVLELLFGEQQRRGFALLLVTHDERLAARCHRQLYMDDGQIQLDSGVPIPQ